MTTNALASIGIDIGKDAFHVVEACLSAHFDSIRRPRSRWD